ncbi:MAG: acyl-CoA dehydratase activase [Thermodesulfobacteriota bacterium]
MSNDLFIGIDVGASSTKAAVLDRDEYLIGHAVLRSGTDFEGTAAASLAEALAMAGMSGRDGFRCVSTGYGRKNVPFREDTKTEISCHAKGCYKEFPEAITIIDIGGQDNKVIKLDVKGRRLNFKMNRKCAAGTGAFLEEMAMRLAVPLEEMDGLARSAEHMVELGSYCTVFSGTEVLEKIRQGVEAPDLVKGIFLSMIRRVLEMDSLSGRVVMTGGVVAHNPYLVDMVRDIIGHEVLVPEHPQLTGAIGAALFAAAGEDQPHSS